MLLHNITLGQGLIEPPKAARGHVTSVNGKIQNNVIYRTSLLLLATPNVRSLRSYLRAMPAARKTDGDVAISRGPLDVVLHSTVLRASSPQSG